MIETEKQTIDLYVSIVEVKEKSIPMGNRKAICKKCNIPSLLYICPNWKASICQNPECEVY